LLTGLVAIVLLQWRAVDKREFIAATLISKLRNARVSDRIEIERRRMQFNQLVEANNAEVEKAMAQRSKSSEQEPESAVSIPTRPTIDPSEVEDHV
jgi:hypothetical protein